MPLTKQELVERCDKLVKENELLDSIELIDLPVGTYILLSKIFGDITEEESKELMTIYFTRIKELKIQREKIRREERRQTLKPI